jgi:hypothetical protein
MAEQYMLKKWIWTDADFDSMTWHDCTIHAFASPENYDLAIDIDYICQCVLSPDKTRYSFWIAPATLVFENVTDIDFQFFNFIALGINVIERVKAQPKADSELGLRDDEWIWTVSCHVGSFEFRATGFKQYIRAQPKLCDNDRFEPHERGGYSFTKGRDVAEEASPKLNL